MNKEQYTYEIRIKVTEAQALRLQRYCTRNGVKRATVIRRLIDKFVSDVNETKFDPESPL